MEMQTEWQLGVDIRKPIRVDDEELRGNYGPDGRYPGAPTCYFKGREVPSFITCSPKGGISSELLTGMLQRMDELHLFPRMPGGPLPFLNIDGHGSRLQLPFL